MHWVHVNVCRRPSRMKNRPPDERRPIDLTREKVAVVLKVETETRANQMLP